MYSDKWFKISDNVNLTIPIVKRNNVYSEIFEIVKFLNNFKSCNYFFSCGTALGLVREGRLLDWDTDVDIDIIEPTDILINDIIIQMQSLGYSYLRILKSKKRYSQVVFIKEPYHSIDFCFWYKDNNSFINDVPETHILKRSHPLEIYKEFKTLNIQNVDFKIPHDTNSYFELLYGQDWQTPKKYKNWLKNANDLKLDVSLSRVFFKTIWKFSNIISRVKKKLSLKF